MKQNQKGRRGRHRNQARRPNGSGQRNSGKPSTRNRGQAKQQVERYTSLAREALQAQDFVNAQNYFQHAEYYQRMLNDLAADSQPKQVPAEASKADQGRRSGKDSSDDQPPGQVVSIEPDDPDQPAADDSDDEAISA